MRRLLKSFSPRCFWLLILLPLLSITAPHTKAQDEAEPQLNDAESSEEWLDEADILDEFVDQDEGARCISLRRLDRTEVLSNQSIVFHMRGKDILVNRLRYRCPGLNRRDTIMFETRSNRLCDLDHVTVLNDIGGRFMRGASCGLGSFYAIDQETVDLLKGNHDQRRTGKRGKGSIE